MVFIVVVVVDHSAVVYGLVVVLLCHGLVDDRRFSFVSLEHLFGVRLVGQPLNLSKLGQKLVVHASGFHEGLAVRQNDGRPLSGDSPMIWLGAAGDEEVFAALIDSLVRVPTLDDATAGRFVTDLAGKACVTVPLWRLHREILEDSPGGIRVEAHTTLVNGGKELLPAELLDFLGLRVDGVPLSGDKA